MFLKCQTGFIPFTTKCFLKYDKPELKHTKISQSCQAGFGLKLLMHFFFVADRIITRVSQTHPDARNQNK